jgi:hypothetical protein
MLTRHDIKPPTFERRPLNPIESMIDSYARRLREGKVSKHIKILVKKAASFAKGSQAPACIAHAN